jgi:autotransporter-associated beta strand protein
VGNNDAGATFGGIIKNTTGSLALTKIGTGTLILTGNNTYSGATTISNGTLLVNGSIGNSAVSVASGATLGGAGTIGGVVTVASGGTLAPGTSIGTLTLNGDPVLNGEMVMEIDKDATPQNADKLVRSGGSLTFGGTLTVQNIGAALTGGEDFDLFDATSFSGSFSATNLPALGANLNWWAGRLMSEGRLRVNQWPTAANTNYTRTRGLGIKFRISEVVELCSDPDAADGDSVTFHAVDSGTEGATVTTNDTHIFYAPANDNEDTLVYTVRDQRGGSRTASIGITVVEVSSTNSVVSLEVGVPGSGTNTITFAGIPGYSYVTEFATNLTEPIFWHELSTNTAGTNGLWTVTDDTATNSSRFYRTVYR